MTLSKLKSIALLAFRGYRLVESGRWKERGALATVLLTAAVAAHDTFGIDLGLTDVQADWLAGGLIVAVNLVLTFITSKKAGLPAGSVPVAWAAGALPPWLAAPDDPRGRVTSAGLVQSVSQTGDPP